MWQIRAARTSDLPSFLELAEQLGPGMTTLPADRQALAAKLERSEASFGGRDASEYILVMVGDADSMLGCAAIYPDIGRPNGFFSYRRVRQVHHSAALGVTTSADVLYLSNDFTGATEVGTLAVHPRARGMGAGRLLAQSRYLLMATAPHLFGTRVMAEMRGWQTSGNSPFWQAVGARFFNMSFAEADRLSATAGAGFIAELLPKMPICLDLLSEEVRQSVGRPHASSALAMRMLLEEGFRYEGLVDVFDAGPQVSAQVDDIATVRHSVRGRLATTKRVGGTSALVATTDLGSFRVVDGYFGPDGNVSAAMPGGGFEVGCSVVAAPVGPLIAAPHRNAGEPLRAETLAIA